MMRQINLRESSPDPATDSESAGEETAKEPANKSEAPPKASEQKMLRKIKIKGKAAELGDQKTSDAAKNAVKKTVPPSGAVKAEIQYVNTFLTPALCR
jgi:hypothetical protein